MENEIKIIYKIAERRCSSRAFISDSESLRRGRRRLEEGQRQGR
jgi:hypothetical protein